MTNTTREISANILIAALQSGAIRITGSTPEEQAESIGKCFEIISRSVQKS